MSFARHPNSPSDLTFTPAVRGFALLGSLAVALAGLSFLIQGRLGINLGDEGFLWYGVQQTVRGSVPIRDFQAYDPGRYYWCAIFSFIFGDKLISVRLAEAAFQVIGLVCGMAAARRVTSALGVLALTAFILAVWMTPSHKIFDHTILLCGIWMITLLIGHSGRKSAFAAGVFVGLCAFFGRNHAVYNLTAEGAVLALLWLKSKEPASFLRPCSWAAGILVGLIPISLMLLFIPGFSGSYLESLQAIFRNGTNLGRAIPWPWMTNYSGGIFREGGGVVLSVLFVSMPVFYCAIILTSLLRHIDFLRSSPVLVGCAFLGAAYLHHAFSRADASHLAQAIHPFLLGLFAIFAGEGRGTRPRIAVALALMMTSIIAVIPILPVYNRFESTSAWVPLEPGSQFIVAQRDANLVRCLHQFSDDYIGPLDGVLIAPFYPGLYPLLQKVSPVSETFFFFPPTPSAADEEIEQLDRKRVNWAFIFDTTIDGRDDLRFSSSHKRLWDHLLANFEAVKVPCAPRTLTILHRKALTSPAQ